MDLNRVPPPPNSHTEVLTSNTEKKQKWLWNGVMSRGWTSFEVHVRKSLGRLEETLGRNVGIKSASGKTANSGGKGILPDCYRLDCVPSKFIF